MVTGGGGGIGRSLAVALADAGANVAVADIHGAAAGEVASTIGGIAARCDVADESDIEALAISAEDLLGPIDLFFSNAGVATPGDPWVSDAEWQRTWDVNVMSHIYAARAVLPSMLERGGEGYLVQTASAAGLLSQIGSAPYAVNQTCCSRLRRVFGDHLRRSWDQGVGAGAPSGPNGHDGRYRR